MSDPILQRAVMLAERGRGATSPNPMVGCIVVFDGVVVGEGFHELAGGPHAEVTALRQAGERARDATVYVTLEPCNHYGKTPPCTAALQSAGVARVVIGMPDPDPHVSGGGADVLRSAGVDVVFASDATPFEMLNEAWLKRLRTGLPWVRVKLGLTIDARAAMVSGRRSTITGTGGVTIARQLRAGSTAVAVGAATVDVDDPKLTVRDDAGVLVGRQPLRVVLSRTSVPERGRGLFARDTENALLVTSDRTSGAALDALVREGVRVAVYPYAEGINGALRALVAEGVDDVLIEAGPGLMSALWSAGCIDELFVVQAGGMAGNAAPPLYLGSADAAGTDLAPRMRAVEAGTEGDDAVVVWRPLHEKSTG
ncbi:MAG: bifunctional diaminohydroxyphosphoribosylaminopyrimidine deaminase/5-amino-6-(5-phosphoribosylamino)uracil reductase RibD [Coriobacteriia bacterium]|nr:bifunctional diaminohydroxyphosphoribosylaminopyrimidine deaminase/5-amino-6-(5-phosphoribosylamino)uracil reductase RibD [Coriobacteriia bacterium]